MLFELDPAQIRLFADDGGPGSLLFRCLKREVYHRSGGRDWREIQANRGMAALLMPKPVFLKAANDDINTGSGGGLEATARRLAARFSVSREAASIRLKTFGFREADSANELFA
jgi:Zn-dependent peptidase ImmA (M78 family)